MTKPVNLISKMLIVVLALFLLSSSTVFSGNIISFSGFVDASNFTNINSGESFLSADIEYALNGSSGFDNRLSTNLNGLMFPTKFSNSVDWNVYAVNGWDFNTENNNESGKWDGLLLLSNWGLSDCVGLTTRFDYFNDKDRLRTGTSQIWKAVAVSPSLSIGNGLDGLIPLDEDNKIIQNLSGMGESEATYFVGSDNLMRSDSRFSTTSTILTQRIDKETANARFADETGFEIVNDYLEIPVLSAFNSIVTK